MLPKWAECESLLLSPDLEEMHTPFLWYLPHLMTEHSMMYTVLTKFYSSIISIKPKTPTGFLQWRGISNSCRDHFSKPSWILNSSSPFRRVSHGKSSKTLLGKLIKGSEFDDTLVETKVFGVKSLEHVIYGSHFDW